MDRAAALEAIREIAVEVLSVDEAAVTEAARFKEDLEADSLDLVELVMGLEEGFSTPDKKLEIPDEDAEKIVTVQDAVDYLRDHGVKDS